MLVRFPDSWSVTKRIAIETLREPAGLVICIAAVGLLIGGIIFLVRPEPRNYDIFGSAHARDPGVICNTYGEGHTVCMAAPPNVKKFREDHRRRREQEKATAP